LQTLIVGKTVIDIPVVLKGAIVLKEEMVLPMIFLRNRGAGFGPLNVQASKG
jgi:hypothetical protein